MNIRPLHDRVIVKRVEAERTTASGIVVHVTTFNPAPAGTMFPMGKVVFRSTFLPGDLR